MGHDHGHHHGGVARSGARHVRPLRLALALIAGFLAVQVVVGLATSSLAVLSDAGHMGAGDRNDVFTRAVADFLEEAVKGPA